MEATKQLLPRKTAILAAAVMTTALAGTTSSPAQAGTTWERSVVGIVDSGLAHAKGAVHVIVTATTGGVGTATRAVTASHGSVHAPLPIVDGVAATVPASDLGVLARQPGVKAVTLDRVAHFSGYSFDGGTTVSGSNFVTTTGAGQAWQHGYTGQGVGVAVIDTGISPMPDVAGRVVYGPDLSGEGTLVDTYGHGTVMGGIIAGNGADSVNQAGGAYTGVAPRATLVSVKTAGANGAVDVSTILQAMTWVSAYQSQFNIRVLNLSFGTPSTQDPSVDPLDYAVERLWKQGIVVVVAAGNSGPNAGTITKPGDDPTVLTVGAYDDKQTPSGGDDVIASWSSRGQTAQGVTKPDVVAPGRYIIAQRSYGSTIEQQFPNALFAPSYIRGSGTSEATAVTSGLVALIVQAHPNWTPDQIKWALRHTAQPLSGQVSANSQGQGRVNVGAAIGSNPGSYAQQPPSSSGLGSIENSRGGQHVVTSCDGGNTTTVIQNEMDVRCEAWDGSAWTGSAWTGSAWTGSAWTGSAWTGSAWTGSAWTGAAWTGSAWTGGTWTGGSWQGSAWTGSAWTGSAWTGSAWTGSAWTGSAWTGSAWTGSAWTSSGYDGDFLTAFWGNHTPWWKGLPGEVRGPRPGFAQSP
ncbi:MAG: serine protease AprX [Frankiaceae bacterium]|nr:serine protease AprX [Frankiaceae bacterium]